MLGRREAQKPATPPAQTAEPTTLLTVVGETARMEGKFDIADSIQIECEVGGETVDAFILGHYDGNMTATGNVEIAATGRVSGNIKTDSLVISKGGCFSGNVSKITEEPGAINRPVYLIEDKRTGQNSPR